ncbi:MAG: hypothetical protein CMI64_00090 [Pedosphaera sp.]|nr:hypothetical protein [Pedosphaera sp.]
MNHPSQMPSIGTLWSDLQKLGLFFSFGMELMGLNQCPKGSRWREHRLGTGATKHNRLGVGKDRS